MQPYGQPQTPPLGPPQGSPSHGSPSSGSPSDPQPPPGRNWRPWIMGAIVALGFACICSIGGVYTCGKGFQRGQAIGVKNITVAMRAAVETMPQKVPYRVELDRLDALAESGRVSFIALGVLSNRFQDISLDGTLTDPEVEHMMALVHDIVAHGGDVNPRDYPQAR